MKTLEFSPSTFVMPLHLHRAIRERSVEGLEKVCRVNINLWFINTKSIEGKLPLNEQMSVLQIIHSSWHKTSGKDFFERSLAMSCEEKHAN